MMFRKSAYAFALGLLCCAGFFACATQVAPGGGPEDKLPPRVAAVYPAPMTTNHPNELYVKLEFDEWINASIPRSAVSISPPIEKKMKFEVSGKTLELTSRAVLDENTTYTITFAGGIKDLHGNALATPFTVVFSTGSEIDSLTLEGRILVNDTLIRKSLFPSVGLFLMGPEREQRKYLEKYRDSVTHALDSVPMLAKEPPLFITRADSVGNFRLTGLKPGRYRVVGFVDANGNQRLEPTVELAGPRARFYDEGYHLDSAGRPRYEPPGTGIGLAALCERAGSVFHASRLFRFCLCRYEQLQPHFAGRQGAAPEVCVPRCVYQQAAVLF